MSGWAPAPAPVQAQVQPFVPVAVAVEVPKSFAAPFAPPVAPPVVESLAPAAQSAPKVPARVAKRTDVDLQALMLAIVAEKTGYPADMLNLGMDLEGDLGIDSIKRVEILSAVADQAPELRSWTWGTWGRCAPSARSSST